MLSSAVLTKIAVELSLGFCIKLFIENGRIHPADFVNDYLFWLPGVHAKPGHGLERQVVAMLGPVEVATETDAQTLRETA